MADILKSKLPLSATLAIAGCLATSGGTIAIANYRIAEQAERIVVVEVRQASDHELLVRIDERTAEMKRILERGSSGSH